MLVWTAIIIENSTLGDNEMMQNHVENPRQKPTVPAKPANLKAKQKLKEHLQQNDEVRRQQQKKE